MTFSTRSHPKAQDAPTAHIQTIDNSMIRHNLLILLRARVYILRYYQTLILYGLWWAGRAKGMLRQRGIIQLSKGGVRADTGLLRMGLIVSIRSTHKAKIIPIQTPCSPIFVDYLLRVVNSGS